MNDVFVLRNQHNEFLNKSSEWISTGDSKALFRSVHIDEVINQKVELTVKHPDLRIKVVEVTQMPNGRINIEGHDCIPKAVPLKVHSNNSDNSDDNSAQIEQTPSLTDHNASGA